MSEYGAMKPLARARLKQQDLKRFECIKAEHDRQEQVLLNGVQSAKTYAEYKGFKAELDLFNAGGDPFANSQPPALPSTPALRIVPAASAEERASRAWRSGPRAGVEGSVSSLDVNAFAYSGHVDMVFGASGRSGGDAA